jgi:hypothetical protein
MPESDYIVYDHVADVVIQPPLEGQRKNALVIATLVAADGTRLRCHLTLKAAVALRAMISAKLRFLVSDTPA